MDYRQRVRQEAQLAGLDPNIAEAVLMRESAGNPNAVSGAGAQGLMQLMPGTAKEMGVNPNDPVQNIQGGVKYLKKQIDQYGVPAGIAAYNAGPGRVAQVGGNFNALPAETRAYVPAVMNTAANLAQGGGRVNQEPDIGQVITALDKAKAANDTAAVAEISGMLQTKFGAARQKAQAAGDTNAVAEIDSQLTKLVGSPKAAAPTPAPQTQPQEVPQAAPQVKGEPTKLGSILDQAAPIAKAGFRKVDDFVRGAADALTFGYADELAAKADSLFGGGQSGKKTYEEALAAQRQRDKEGGAARFAGQVAGSLVPTGTAIRASQTAGRLGRAGVGALTGAAQGAAYGSGSAEGDINDRIDKALVGGAVGGVGGGVLGGIMPATVSQVANKLEKKAGDPKSAAMDAEIIQDLGTIARNPNLRGKDVRAKLANNLEDRYYSQVDRLTKKLSDEDLAKLGTSRDKIDEIIGTAGERNIVSQEALQQLRGNKVGNALADAVEKAQRTASLTQQVTSSPLLSPVRGALGAMTPEWFARGMNTMLGGKKDRVDVIQNYLKPKMLEAAQELQARNGPSVQTQSKNALEALVTQKQKAQEALAQRTAQQQVEAQAAQQAQKAQTLADNATARQNMGMRGSPLSGPYATTLEYSGATNEQAIPVLRQLVKDNKGTEIGKAAKQLLKSDPRVENSPAFYAVQGILKDVVGGGALTDVTAKAAATVGKIGGNNPASKIVKGLDDATVANLVGRTEDMSGKPINGARKYLVGKIANILDDQKNGNALDQEALDLLKAIGM